MNRPARFACVFLSVFLLLSPLACRAEEERIAPAWPVPEYVEHLLLVASEEVGYTEDHGRTKYGEWAGDPYAQWCAEFQSTAESGTDTVTGTRSRISRESCIWIRSWRESS